MVKIGASNQYLVTKKQDKQDITKDVPEKCFLSYIFDIKNAKEDFYVYSTQKIWKVLSLLDKYRDLF